VLIDPHTGKVAQRLAVGNDPGAIAVGSGRVWAANFRDGTVSKLDATTSAAETITVNGPPLSLAVHGGDVFVVDGPPANSLTLISADSGNAYDIVQLPNSPTGGTTLVAAGPSGVWLADEQGATVSRVDARPGQSDRLGHGAVLPLRKVADLNGLAVGPGAVWVVGNDLDPRLWRIDPQTEKIARRRSRRSMGERRDRGRRTADRSGQRQGRRPGPDGPRAARDRRRRRLGLGRERARRERHADRPALGSDRPHDHGRRQPDGHRGRG
jgi:hypothetical protein